MKNVILCTSTILSSYLFLSYCHAEQAKNKLNEEGQGYTASPKVKFKDLDASEARAFLKKVKGKGVLQKSMATTLKIGAPRISEFLNAKGNALSVVTPLNTYLSKNTLFCGVKITDLIPTTSTKKASLKVVRKKVTPPPKKAKKKFVPESLREAPIEISYRSDGEGKGAFYDHYTVQKSTRHKTHLVKPEGMRSTLHVYAKQQVAILPYGTKDEKTQKNLPPIKSALDKETGLLFIPGRARGVEDADREKFELDIIRQARLQGRPILAVCAGSWRLWEAYGGRTKEVKDHNYNGGMLRLNDDGVVTYNVHVHDVKVEPKTLLSSIMSPKSKEDTIKEVNSVHWLAPDDTAKASLPKDKQTQSYVKALHASLKVSGRSVADPEVSLKTRQGIQMEPEEETVEAFETLRGAPVIGIQWHPEAYCHYREGKKIYYDSEQKSILEFMAKAGDAYVARKRMTSEFMGITNKLKSATSSQILKAIQKEKGI
ncbi:MAG: gamma-glutamyl-gamma-aminobutyrate hydrolase family protein [Proteobacteria bacterium]|nr:gamma-glutamyl-gamma-aminobutyrate hydrolase family protein [Pseudomonadota bacterium]